jgi:tetratricopeptide (TPR) repeat protein
MSTITRALGVAALACALFIVGGLGLLRATAPVAAPAGTVGSPGSGAPAVAPQTLRSTIASLQDRLEVVPEDGHGWASLGIAYVEAARIFGDPAYYPKAEEALDRAVALGTPGDDDPLLGMGTLALARHDFAGALGWGRRALGVNPDDASVYGVIGDAQIELGRYRAAFATFDTMVATRPDLSSYARLAYARELRGDVTGAMRAMTLAEGAAGTPQDRAWTAAQIGDLAWRSGRPRLAEAAYERSLAWVPAYLPARAGLARVAWGRGDLRGAIAAYRWITARSPLPEHVIALGDLYTATGRTDAASVQYDLARAEAALLRANGVNVEVELAVFEADHGDPAVALRQARAGWASRHSIHAADALAWALYRAGSPEEALPYARLALRLGTADAAIHFHAGMIALAAGETDAARDHLETALAINPRFSILQAPVAARILDRLRAA